MGILFYSDRKMMKTGHTSWQMEVSWNGGTPSSHPVYFHGFSMIFQYKLTSFWGSPIYGNPKTWGTSDSSLCPETSSNSRAACPAPGAPVALENWSSLFVLVHLAPFLLRSCCLGGVGGVITFLSYVCWWNGSFNTLWPCSWNVWHALDATLW